jgi:hypothetical protein
MLFKDNLRSITIARKNKEHSILTILLVHLEEIISKLKTGKMIKGAKLFYN